MGVMQPQAKRRLESPEAGRGKEGSPRATGGSVTVRTPRFQNSDLQNCKRINLCCLKPPNAWHFITAVIRGN